MIRSNYSDHQSPRLQILTEEQCQELFFAALACLDRVGVQINNARARELLAASGARSEGNVVRLPSYLVKEALSSVPPAFTIWGRGYNHPMHVSPGRVYFGPGPTCTYYMDPKTGQRRKAYRGDAAFTARTCDALEHIDYVMGLSLFDDVTPVLSPVYEFAESISNTTKPIMAWANTPANLGDIYQIALAVVGDEIKLREKPIFGFFATYESPLRIACEALDNLLWAVDHDIPSVLLGGPSVGLDSPFTAASALVIHLATALAGVTITQLKRRGAPIAIGGLPTAMDLRTARPSYGAPETCLNTAAAADLANYLKLPFMGTAGASESKKVDAQAGLEAALQILTSGLSGAGMVHDVGFLDCADIGSLQYLILSNEIIGMVKRILRGITVNPETIMLDLLEQVGPGGNYLTEPRSAVLCRKETWIPKILDRDPFILWEQRGSKDTAQRLQEMLDKILETHQPDPLLDGAEGKIQKILEIAEARENSQAAVIVT